MDYFTDREFQSREVPSGKLRRGTYDTCVFRDIDFSGNYLDGITCMDCEFISCNLSNVKMGSAQFSDTRFIGCKMLGMHIENLGLLSANLKFTDCMMDLISFTNLNLKGMECSNCSLNAADFTASDLSYAVFMRCDLNRAVFYQTNLEAADFVTSHGVRLDPEQNKIRKAKFSLELLPGLLEKYGIEIDP